MNFKRNMVSGSPPVHMKLHQTMVQAKTPGHFGTLRSRKASAFYPNELSDPLGPASITGAKLGKNGLTYEEIN